MLSLPILLLLVVSVGVVIFSGLYIWYMNRQWFGESGGTPPTPPETAQTAAPRPPTTPDP